jgi:hypothetical protein
MQNMLLGVFSFFKCIIFYKIEDTSKCFIKNFNLALFLFDFKIIIHCWILSLLHCIVLIANGYGEFGFHFIIVFNN